MRIASSHLATTIQGTLGEGNARLSKLMTQISSGQRITRPSDDPIASVRLRMIERDEVLLGQYRKNIGTLTTQLERNETHLKGMLDTVMSAHDLLVWALDGANTTGDLNAMSTTLRSLRDNLHAAANAMDSEGNYLFSGTLTSTAPIGYDPTQPAGARYSFDGNDKRQQVAVGNGVTQAGNVSVDSLAEVLNQIDAALAVLEDPAADANDPAMRAVLVAAEGAVTVGMDSLTARMSEMGGARNTIALLDDTHAAMQIGNAAALEQVAGLDVAEAYDRLTRHTVAIQATYQVYGRIMQLNPFDLL